jgi:hypothetical protein
MRANFSDGGDTVARSEEPASRRLVGDNPLEGGGFFGKPVGLVKVDFGGHHPSLSELKIRNVLVAESLRQLAIDPEGRDFVARAALLRRAAGQLASRGNSRLHAALDRMTIPIRKPLLGDTAVPTLTSWESLDPETVSWRFDERIRELLRNPQVWAWLDLGICASLRRTASLLLYERLRLVANRD